MPVQRLTMALPKGKLYEPTVQLLNRSGLGGGSLEGEESRRLFFDNDSLGLRFIVARPADVPTYVAHGAADLGIVGKDVLLEDHQVYAELLDLGYGGCRFVMAAPVELAASAAPGALVPGRSITRVATKFPRVAEAYLRQKGWPAEIIVLHGAVELAPAAGLADAIVDIVSTGQTLRENRLVPLETIAESSARLIANPAALHLKREGLEPLVRRLRQSTEEVAPCSA